MRLITCRSSIVFGSFWERMRKTAGPGCQQRLMSTLDVYFQAIMQQADDRGHRNIPDLEEYILLRRDTSGCKTGFAFIEYAANIDLPDEVAEHPVIVGLSNATNDLVSWANVSRICPRYCGAGSLAFRYTGRALVQC